MIQDHWIKKKIEPSKTAIPAKIIWFDITAAIDSIKKINIKINANQKLNL